MTEKELECGRLVQHVILAAISHPLTQARVLIQLGHEPGPIRSKNPSLFGLLGRGGDYRSGVLTGYLRESGIFTDGHFARNITTGMTMSICEVVASSLIKTAVTEPLERNLPSAENEQEYSNYNQVLVDITRESAIKSAGVIVANPFRVAAIRQIASIAGGTSVDSTLQGVILSGDLFSGVVPRILFQTCVTFVSKTLKYLCRESGDVLGIDKNNQKIADIAIDHVTNIFVYPLQLISTIRSIGGTGLRLDEYSEFSLLELYLTLHAQGDTQRGSSMLFDRRCPRTKKVQEIQTGSLAKPNETESKQTTIVEIPETKSV